MLTKVFVVGHFEYNFYEDAFVHALMKNHVSVEKIVIKPRNKWMQLIWKFEEYFTFFGPFSFYYFFSLKKKIVQYRPELIIFWRPTIIFPNQLKSLKKFHVFTSISYNNDNPFGKLYQNKNFRMRRLWNGFIRSIPYFDVNLVFRPSNIIDYDRVGSKRTILFPPSFIPDLIPDLRNRYIKNDVIFIGYSELKRIKYINYLLDAGIRVKIFGSGWNLADLHQNYGMTEIIPIYGDVYYQELFDSTICLAFLSDLNEDVYTTRNFEIPGIESLMLSERTPELIQYFKEDEEAFFFSDEVELLQKVQFILANEDIQKKVRSNAKKRSIESGYDIDSRVKNLLNKLKIEK
jgi:glycosyltransferase involved in cell wall biosynthesis